MVIVNMILVIVIIYLFISITLWGLEYNWKWVNVKIDLKNEHIRVIYDNTREVILHSGLRIRELPKIFWLLSRYHIRNEGIILKGTKLHKKCKEVYKYLDNHIINEKFYKKEEMNPEDLFPQIEDKKINLLK